MLMVVEWWSKRSRMAEAMTLSAKMAPLRICNDCLKHQKITSVILDHAFDLKLSIRKNEQHFNQATHEYRAPVEEIVLIGCVDLFGDTPARSPDRPREFGAAQPPIKMFRNI